MYDSSNQFFFTKEESMSDLMSIIGHSESNQDTLNEASLMITILRLAKKESNSWGPTEEKIREESGLAEIDFLKTLSKLVNDYKCVTHRLCQEVTGGECYHRYSPVKGMKFEILWGEEDKGP